MNGLLTNVCMPEAFPYSYPSFSDVYDRYSYFQAQVQTTHRLTRKEYEKLCDDFEQYRNEVGARLRACYTKESTDGTNRKISNEVKKFYEMLMYRSQIPLLAWFD